MRFYKVVDRLTQFDKDLLGIKKGERVTVKAVFTSQYRPPLAGEWYISGAIPEAYRAPNNFSSSYHIARLVRMPKTR